MDTVLIVLVLAVVIVGAVIWVRRKGREDARPPEQRHEQDTAWNDPLSRGQDPKERQDR